MRRNARSLTANKKTNFDAGSGTEIHKIQLKKGVRNARRDPNKEVSTLGPNDKNATCHAEQRGTKRLGQVRKQKPQILNIKQNLSAIVSVVSTRDLALTGPRPPGHNGQWAVVTINNSRQKCTLPHTPVDSHCGLKNAQKEPAI